MHGTDSEFCTQISKSLNCIVLDAGYAKAPEYPFPAAFHDVEDVLSYVLSSPEGLYDTERITIGGFSAGATLALGVAGCSPIANGTVKGVVAFYPGTDFTKNGWDLDKISPAPGPPKLKANRSLVRARFSPSSINFFQKCYVPPSISKTDPRLSPVFIPPSNLPPMLVFAAGYDSLRKSAEDFAMSVKAGGGKIAWKTFENVGHYWDKLANPRMKEYEDRNEAYSMSVAFLKECFGERRGSL
jgi:acetyl esterase/lipase